MSDEDTLTTEEVRETFAQARMSLPYYMGGSEEIAEWSKAFDRWLAAHDAEVRTETAPLDDYLAGYARWEAIRTVAAWITARLLGDYDEDGDEWGMYPEIGERDWLEVVKAVRAQASEVTPEEYQAAYKVLEAAADKGVGDG